MNFFKLPFMNLKQNLRNYGMYIFSMVFSIIVFYNFTSLMFSEQFRALQDLNIVSSIAGSCTMVLFLFFVYFISYSSSFFIEQRKKEFGIYTFMGVENSKISLLFSIDGLLIGIVALICGILGGILSNKLFLMALVKVSSISTVMKFEVSIKTIIITSIVFLGILACVFIKEYIVLLRTDITKLINATNIYQSDDSKNKTLQGMLGLTIIALAYVLILYYKRFNIPFPMAIMATVMMVIVGTILLFKGFFTFVVSKLINNKNFLYKGTNILSYNNIIFRIRDNNKVLGQIAVLITCCLTSVIVSISMKTLFVDSKESEFPYSIMYLGNENDKVINEGINLNKEDIDFKINTKIMPYNMIENKESEFPYSIMYLGNENDKVINEGINLNKEDIDFKINTKIMPYNMIENDNGVGAIPYINDLDIIKYSDVEKIMDHRNLDNEKRFLKTNLKDYEAIFVIPKSLINAFNFNVKLSIGNNEIKVIDSYSLNLFGRFRDDRPSLIVNDNTYDHISKDINSSKLNINAITLKNFDNTEKISEYVRNNSDIDIYSVDKFKPEDYNFVNSIYFIGLFLALVFVVSVVSIMYFKCISDASKDKPRFDTLRKIGISQDYINRSIFKQIGIFFLFPIAIAIVHSIIAGYAVTSMFNQDGRASTLITIIGFCMIYIFYYLLTVRKYIELTK